MQNRVAYHASAVSYNKALLLAAEEQAKLVEDPTVQKWCRSVANLHRFHLKQHRAALARLQSKKKQRYKKNRKPAQPHKSIAQEQVEFAKQQEQIHAGNAGVMEKQHASEGQV